MSTYMQHDGRITSAATEEKHLRQAVQHSNDHADAAVADLAAAHAPQHPDDAAVDRFAAAMKDKMARGRAKGRAAWDDPNACTVEHLAQLLLGHIPKGNAGNFEDIANLSMMLHQRGADPAILRGTPAPEAETPSQSITVAEALRVLLTIVKIARNDDLVDSSTQAGGWLCGDMMSEAVEAADAALLGLKGGE